VPEGNTIGVSLGSPSRGQTPPNSWILKPWIQRPSARREALVSISIENYTMLTLDLLQGVKDSYLATTSGALGYLRYPIRRSLYPHASRHVLQVRRLSHSSITYFSDLVAVYSVDSSSLPSSCA